VSHKPPKCDSCNKRIRKTHHAIRLSAISRRARLSGITTPARRTRLPRASTLSVALPCALAVPIPLAVAMTSRSGRQL
jgi:hypothetical protein